MAWFTSPSLDQQFEFCGKIGKGHPDPDIIYAEDQFYLVTQTKEDFISPGPWVDGVEIRIGVDTDGDEAVDQWTEWQRIKEDYQEVPKFAKHVGKTPAKLDLKDLPEGRGFQFEVRLSGLQENNVKPILDSITFEF